MSKNLSWTLLCSAMLALMSSSAFALQSGGVEIGDLQTGSVVGQPFKALQIDAELIALCVGGHKAWYPPVIFLDLRPDGTGARPRRPVLIKITNSLSLTQGISLSADSSFAGPTSLRVGITVRPGETKYVGIPISDLTYVTAPSLINYHSHTDSKMLGGQLVILK